MNENTMRRGSGLAPALAQWRWFTALAALLGLAAVLLLAGAPAPASAENSTGVKIQANGPWFEGETVRMDLSQYLDADNEYMATEGLPTGLSLEKYVHDDESESWEIRGTLAVEVEPYLWADGDITVAVVGADGKTGETVVTIAYGIAATLETVVWRVD